MYEDRKFVWNTDFGVSTEDAKDSTMDTKLIADASERMLFTATANSRL